MQTIWADKRKGGLLVSFLNDYKRLAHLVTVNASCGNCFKDYYKHYLDLTENKENMADVKCDWKLHGKYNGINLNTQGRPIRNGEMTNEQALELYTKHPRGKDLFEIIPNNIEELLTPKKAEKKPTKKRVPKTKK